MFKNVKKLFLIGLMIILSIQVISAEEIAEDTVLGTLTNTVITKKTLDFKISKIPPMYVSRYKTIDGQKKVLDNICVEEAFYQEGLELGIDKKDVVELTIKDNIKPIMTRIYRDKEFKKEIVITNEMKKKYYNENIKDFKINPSYSILYIQAKDNEDAAKARAEIDNDVDFIDVLNKYSINKYSKDRGGDISNIANNGYIRGIGKDLVLDSLIATSELKTWIGPVETEKGIHLFYVKSFIPESTKKFSDVEKSIEMKIKPFVESQNYYKKVDELVEKYAVEVHEDIIKKINILDLASNDKIKEEKVITSNRPDVFVTVAQVLNKFKKIQPQEREKYMNPAEFLGFTKASIEDELFYLDAITKGYDKDERVQSDIELLRKNAIMRLTYTSLVQEATTVDENEIETYYNNNREEKYTNKAYRKVQTFVFDNKKLAKKTLKKAKKALKKDNNEQIFTSLVKEFSLETKGNGILKRVYQDGTIPGFGKDEKYSKEIWKTYPGALSKIFQNNKDQYVFVRVISDVPLSVRPFDEVKENIKNRLKKENEKKKLEEVIKELNVKHNVKKYPERLEIKLSARELFDLAEESQKKKKFNDAIMYYDQIVKNHKNNSDDYKAMFMKAFLYAEDLQNKEEAIKTFENVLKKFPKGELHESAEYMIKDLKGEIDIFNTDK